MVLRGVIGLVSNVLDGNRQILGFRCEGDLLCSGFNRFAPDTEAYAFTDSTLLHLPHAKLMHFATQSRDFGRQMLSCAALQFEQSNLQKLVLGKLRREERVVTFLLEVALRTGRHIGSRIELELPMTREDIADYLGLNVATVSRIVSKLRRKGILSLTSPTVGYIEDLDALSAMTPLADELFSLYGERSEVNGFPQLREIN